MEKYKELYNLSKEVLNEEQNRFSRIDEKASKYLSVITLLIGVFGFLGKWVLDSFLPPKDKLEWLILITGFLFYLILFISWLFIFKVLRIHEIRKIPLNSDMIEFFDNNKLLDIYYALAKGNKDTLAENRKTTNQKSKMLARAYRMIILAGYLLFLFLILFFFIR